MKMKKKPSGYWTYEKCKEVALEYNNRKELRDSNNWVYNKILRKKWNELFDHMEVLGSISKRMIYVYEFDDNHCYVGLTYNIKKRNGRHLNDIKYKSSVRKHIEKTSLMPKLIEKTDYIPCQEASILEENYIKIYIENGWKLLNKNKGGVLGGSNIITWTYDRCVEVALKCKTRSEFQKEYSGAYHRSRKSGWLNEICDHMYSKYWNYEKVKKESLKYDGRWDFLQYSSGAYYWAKNNKVLDDVCSHMKIKRKTWTYESCEKEASIFNSRSEYYRKSQVSYNKSRINNWLDDFFPKK